MKLIEYAAERHDETSLTLLQNVLDSQGEEASVNIHQGCYCSYTSKEHIQRGFVKSVQLTLTNHQLFVLNVLHLILKLIACSVRQSVSPLTRNIPIDGTKCSNVKERARVIRNLSSKLFYNVVVTEMMTEVRKLQYAVMAHMTCLLQRPSIMNDVGTNLGKYHYIQT